MNPNDKNLSPRLLVLIAMPKLTEKATKIFYEGSVPVHYKMNALGTASSEMMDILGLGSPDKRLMLSMLPKSSADKMLQRLKSELKLGAVNSGIAFTLPLSGVNNLMLKMLGSMEDENILPHTDRKDEKPVTEIKNVMIAAIVNQGYSELVMDAAKAEGAGGGTLLHSRRIGKEATMSFWGLSVQEEKDIVLIITDIGNKLKIMQAISEKCGMHSEAKGIVVSLPIDAVIGLDSSK